MGRCPICAQRLDHHSCHSCQRAFSTEVLLAIQCSVRFHATAVNKTIVRIKPDTGQGAMIREIFEAKDRSFAEGVWTIHHADQYRYVPCVKAALNALGKQIVMFA